MKKLTDFQVRALLRRMAECSESIKESCSRIENLGKHQDKAA